MWQFCFLSHTYLACYINFIRENRISYKLARFLNERFIWKLTNTTFRCSLSMELHDGSARSAVRSNGKWPRVQFPIDIFFRERRQPIIQIRRREISRRRKERKGERKKDRDPKVDRKKNLFSTRTTTFDDVYAISAHAAYIFHTWYARFPFVDKKITVRLHLRHLAQYRPPRQSQLAGRIERGNFRRSRPLQNAY